ncbi:acylneuraminate cytidylyltransferase family protein [Actinokineospora diospyrosa]|uniref:N-acylneuraminate cytidylyltransferase n=1 Tax=Actinokineospora diospyrosa TaxID=103728 RepID=A0ABT1ID72_9PSEU|nr:acylneuraminate cytidylyltransferase family protein [Actinokineospora diospyrosa]MCP2270578.1 N-acylneuraminate cytidylyltransferase [Actinokineospora diospyrosa]
MTDVVAVVTARSGSVGFPGKNLALFRGRPLVAHAVLTALETPRVDRVVVTTDDTAIAKASAGAEIVYRPPALSRPDSRSVDAVLHAVDELGIEDALLVLLQPTSPLRTAGDVAECLRLHGDRTTGSVVQMSAGEEHHPWKACVLDDGRLRPAHDWADLEAPRQNLPQVLRPTGGVYVVGLRDLRAHRRFFVPEVLAQVVPAARAIDIDSPADLARAHQ